MSSAPRHIDVCNGDADGLGALLQWRLAHPVDAASVVRHVGLKRDHTLLHGVQARAGDEVTVIDMSLDGQRDAVLALLAAGVRVHHIDHHFGQPLPAHPLLRTDVDTAGDVCSGLIVHRLVGGRFPGWAVVCAHGDNLHGSARALGQAMGLDTAGQQALRTLGEALNHNAYGDSLADVRVPPAELLQRLMPFADPRQALRDDPTLPGLVQGMAEDMAHALAVPPCLDRAQARVWQLPDAAWARRASGSLANRHALAHPQQACAVMRPRAGGLWVVSVRAPLAHPQGAAALCQAFGGGGRDTAGGIDALADTDVPAFLSALQGHAWVRAAAP